MSELFPFEGNPEEFIDKPLYSINFKDEVNEKEVLDFINAQYINLQNSPLHFNRISNQHEDLAFYSGYACPLGSKQPIGFKNPIIITNEGASIRQRHRKFTRVTLNHLKDIVDNLVSRFSIRKPNYLVSPKNEFLMDERGKARTAKKFLLAKSQETNFTFIHTQFISHALIFGEAYLEVFWNPDKGPFQVDDIKERNNIPLLDADGNPKVDPNGKIIKISSRQKIGEVDIKLVDPRRLITQKADSFAESEWSIVYDHISVDKLRLKYPEKADKIKSIKDLEVFHSAFMDYTQDNHSTILFKLYHRPTPEIPHGRLILATPHVILLNIEYPHNTVIDQDLFPIIQLRLEDLPGTERGHSSIISMGKHIQLAINNLINSQVRNVALFPPLRVWEESSIDKDKLSSISPIDITYKRGRQPPKVLSTEPVSQSVILLINMLTERLLQLSNVLPPTRGQTIPNTESRLMLDFFKDQELAQSLPLDTKVKDTLVQVAKLWMAIASEEYDKSESKKRMIKFFGERNSLIQEPLDVAALKIPYDISIEVLNTFADTFQGKIQQITQLLQIVPDALTPAKILDILELGNPEELLDSATAAVDLAERELNDILDGKEVPPPQKYIDIIPYYEQYFKAVQRCEIRKILPDIYDPLQNSESLKGKDKIAQRLLDQIAGIELIIKETIDNIDLSVPVNEQGIPMNMFKTEILTRFPTFPTILKFESTEIVDPFEIEKEVLPDPTPLSGSEENISPENPS